MHKSAYMLYRFQSYFLCPEYHISVKQTYKPPVQLQYSLLVIMLNLCEDWHLLNPCQLEFVIAGICKIYENGDNISNSYNGYQGSCPTRAWCWPPTPIERPGSDWPQQYPYSPEMPFIAWYKREIYLIIIISISSSSSSIIVVSSWE